MQLLRECSISYSFPQARALLAAAMRRELTDAELQLLVCGDDIAPDRDVRTRRALAFKAAFLLLPGGNETRKRRRPARLKQRTLPGVPLQ